MRVLIVGWGYVGSVLGARLAREGHNVFGLRRAAAAPDQPPLPGVELFQADITDSRQLQRIPTGYDWVVNCVAASGGGPDAYDAVYVRGNANLLAWLKNAPPRKFIYTSSTGVYGQNNGETVDELSPTEPDSPTGQALVRAEGVLFRAAREVSFPAVVLRLAGIYGPDRGYWLKQFLDGNPALEGDGSRILNMVHRDDVVGAIQAALERGVPGDICNVVDDQPATQREVFEWLAQRLCRPMPGTAPPDAAPRKRGVTNKRVSNLRLRQEYKYALEYPTFREGFENEIHSLQGGQAVRDSSKR